MATAAKARSPTSLLAEVRSLIPPLSPRMHKGQAGRVGVVGGSNDYTGAPYFASMASMRLGADMSHTICHPRAGDVIKTYSPDLIVHRVLDEESSPTQIHDKVKGVFQRLHAVCVGPGLGRDEHMQRCGRIAVELARSMDIYLVIDADGLWLVQNQPELVRGYARAILTPNVVEFGRLCDKLGIDHSQKDSSDHAIRALAKALDGPTILQKGRVDRICNGDEVIECTEPGGLKRCGGQGDFLSGFVTTFLAWAHVTSAGSGNGGDTDGVAPRGQAANPAGASPSRRMLLAAYGAAVTARACSRETFRKRGRSMLANDMVEEIGGVYTRLWGDAPSAL